MTAPHITIVIGNPGPVSRTKVLALALADAVCSALPRGQATTRTVLELGSLAPHIVGGSGPLGVSSEGEAALRSIANADLLIAATPVYKGSYTGLFKHLFDLVDPQALVDRPVLLAANGGSHRHALVVDHQLRPLFAFFRALTVPSAVYAAESDFEGYQPSSPALQQRMAEAADQAARLLQSRLSGLATAGEARLRAAA